LKERSTPRAKKRKTKLFESRLFKENNKSSHFGKIKMKKGNFELKYGMN
jgi:hypothetical protein